MEDNMSNLTKTPTLDRSIKDWQALWSGILFSAVFTLIIWAAGENLTRFREILLPDTGATWYYWKLPEPTLITRLSAWGLYALHQVFFWGLIYYAQTNVKRYSSNLQRINWIALLGNALFITLHFAQTHLFYDGLAQDVSIFSSQGSVILLLVWVIVLENKRRGFIWGHKLPLNQRVNQIAREYHGYVFAWAAVYTFWYHPMENTAGHLVGFFYMFLLLLQGSLLYTRVHTNRLWVVVQEATVLIHGTMVAWLQAGTTGFWPMFFFGFLSIFVLTQMHGLGFSKRTRWLISAAFVLSIVGTYAWRGWGNLNEVIRIPVIEYLCALLLIGIFWVWSKVKQQRQSAA